MNNKADSEQGNKKKTAIVVSVLVVLLIAIIAGSYKWLSKVQAETQNAENSQEQFVGTVQVSEQLSDECEKSAEKISDLAEKKDAVKMFLEYREHAENCREVYFSIEDRGHIRSEGSYPDLIVDIATIAAASNKSQAIDMLNFAKNLGAWEFYMGPVVCNSNSAIDAYLESVTNAENKVCYSGENGRAKFIEEIKNRDLTVLDKLAGGADGVVYVGSLESDTPCPDKVSTAVKLVQNALNANLSFEEIKSDGQGGALQRFIFKSKDEVKLELDFTSIDNCLRLQSVLVSEQQVNE